MSRRRRPGLRCGGGAIDCGRVLRMVTPAGPWLVAGSGSTSVTPGQVKGGGDADLESGVAIPCRIRPFADAVATTKGPATRGGSVVKKSCPGPLASERLPPTRLETTTASPQGI